MGEGAGPGPALARKMPEGVVYLKEAQRIANNTQKEKVMRKTFRFSRGWIIGHDGRDPCDRAGWHRHSDGGHCGHRQWQQHSKEGLERHEISCWTLLCAWPAGQGLLPVPAPCPAGPHAGPRSLIGMAQDLLT